MVPITECTVMNTLEMHQIGYHRLDHGEKRKHRRKERRSSSLKLLATGVSKL